MGSQQANQEFQPEKKGRKLVPEEIKEKRQGQVLYEMTKSEGWQIIAKWYQDRAIHTWVDPREIEGPEAEKEWKWKELNAFHSADVSRQVLEDIEKLINRSEYLGKIETGEIEEGKPMKI